MHYQVFSTPLESVGTFGKYLNDSDRIWSRQDTIQTEFDNTCGYWKIAVQAWRDKVDSRKSKYPLQALQVRSGAGDRLSGLVTAVNHAMQRGRKLQVFWEGMDLAFRASSKIRALTGESLVEIRGDGM